MRFLLVSNSLTSGIAKIFHPIVYAVAWTLAFIYGIVPNYGIAIAILTVLIMAILTPLTVKSTRSMISMQRLQPELRRLQQKYKGPENRQALNEEMMKLYKEEGVNPASGCIAGFLAMPFLLILYSVIRGLANVVTVKDGKFGCQGYPYKVPSSYSGLLSCPKNIPVSSKMYHDLISSRPPGSMFAFHMNLALKPLSPHGSFLSAVPFYVIIVVAVGLQYFQMSQINRRNQNANQLSNQMQMFQRITPLLFAYIYFLVPAAAAVYMIFSSIIRIITQDLVFRFDRPKAPAPKEKSIPAATGDVASQPVAAIVPTANGGPTRKPAAASAPKLPPSHPRAKDKRKRKAR